MNKTKKREMEHCYYIIELTEEMDSDNYQYEMLKNNRIDYILPFDCRLVDGNPRLYYDITGLTSLEERWGEKELEEKELKSIFQGIIKGLEAGKEYLLEAESFLIGMEDIYIDAENQIFLCCIPGSKQDIFREYHNLAEKCLLMTNHKNPEAVSIIYEIYKLTMQDFYSFQQILAVFTEKKTSIEQYNSDKEENFMEEEPVQKLLDYSEQFEKPKLEKGQKVMKNILRVLPFVFIGGAVLYKVQNGEVDLFRFGVFLIVFTAVGTWLYVKRKDSKEEPEFPLNRETTILYGEKPEPSGWLMYQGESTCPSFCLTKMPFVIGQPEGMADGCVGDSSVSKRHAQIYKKGETYYLTDLNSTNGTYLNGKRLVPNKKEKLRDKDCIRFSRNTYCFQMKSEA